jgi:hypothetical protein
MRRQSGVLAVKFSEAVGILSRGPWKMLCHELLKAGLISKRIEQWIDS